MNKLKILGIIALALGVLFSVVMSLSKPDTIVIRQDRPVGGITNFDELQADRFIVNATSTLGGLSGLAEVRRSATFADATTTLCFWPNPFGATSTADLAIVNLTGVATTSVRFYVGTSTLSSTETAPGAASLIFGGQVGTGSLAYIVSDSERSGTRDNGSGVVYASSSATTNARLTVSPTQFLIFYATGSDVSTSSASFAETGNTSETFDGTCAVRFTR